MSMLKPYEAILKGWDSSKFGPKPTATHLKEIQKVGFARDGSKTAFALAMMLRENGATQVQIKEALGATYRNKANQLCLLGVARLKPKKLDGTTSYRLEVRTKGRSLPHQAEESAERHLNA